MLVAEPAARTKISITREVLDGADIPDKLDLKITFETQPVPLIVISVCVEAIFWETTVLEILPDPKPAISGVSICVAS